MSGEWQPIETAPKDGSNVLLHSDRGMAVGFYDDYLFGEPYWVEDFRGKGNANIVDATHWMPLPKPPPPTA